MAYAIEFLIFAVQYDAVVQGLAGTSLARGLWARITVNSQDPAEKQELQHCKTYPTIHFSLVSSSVFFQCKLFHVTAGLN